MVAGDLRDGPDPGLAHDDGVAADVAETGRVALHPGVEDLHRLILGHGAGDHPGLAAGAVEVDVHLALGLLAAVGQELLLDDDFGVLPHHGPGVALGVVHAPDLAGLQGHGGPFLQEQNGLGVQNALARAFTLAVVLLHIGDPGVAAHIEGVDAVVLAVAVAAVVDAAPGHNPDVGVLADIEVVVHRVVEAGFGHHHGDVDALGPGAGIDADVDAVLIGLGGDVDVLGIPAEGFLTVGADVHRALGGNGGQLGHLPQNSLLDFVQHMPSTSSRLQPAAVSAMMRE